MRDPIRTGVVGVGAMGENHARVYAELSGTELVGVADADRARASDVATRYGADVMSVDALLDAVDAVSLAVPTAAHADLTRRCIENDVAVLVEKPFVEDVETGRELVEFAREEDVVVQVGHVERFNPAVRALPAVVKDLDVIAVDARRVNPPLARDIEDSAVMDLMIHDIDVLLSVVDADVTNVTAVGTHENRFAVAGFEFDDGTVGQLTASRLSQERTRELTITAHDRRIEVDYDNQSIHVVQRPSASVSGDGDLEREKVVQQLDVDDAEPLRRELESFAAAVDGAHPPEVSGRDGLRVVRLAKQIDDTALDDRSEAIPL